MLLGEHLLSDGRELYDDHRELLVFPDVKDSTLAKEAVIDDGLPL
jgi:hypothetical protein